jgi:crotonobetaine/carnitine-CoA ligase
VWNRFSVSQFWSRVAEAGVTQALFLDVMTSRLLNQPPSDTDSENTLRYVYMQPLNQRHHEFCERFNVDFVFTGFGMTECSICVLMLVDERTAPAPLRGSELDPQDICQRFGVTYHRHDEELERGLMGVEADFMQAELHDESGASVENGTAGELCLRPRVDNIVLKGYHGNPSATARVFEDGWMHTGDLVRRNTAGELVFVDRMSGTLRVRGEKFSSFQVEEVLASHAAVGLAAVVGVPAQEGDEDDVYAFVTIKPHHQIEGAELRAWLGEVLPRYMVPREVIVENALPMTSTNKIAKFRLREMVTARQDC